jgi:site-specific DNA-methyltransferase (adenine-specific)
MKCPDSIEQLQELEKLLPLCKVTLYEQAKARMEKHPEKSEREISREMAEELGRDPEVIRQTVIKGKKLVTALPPKELNLTESEKQILAKTGRAIEREKKAERKQQKEADKQAAVEVIAEQAMADISDVCDIRCCSMQELLASVKPDCIITDPPYPKQYLNLYLELAEAAKDVPLVAVMCGQSYLPEVIAAMCQHLKYRWTLAYMTPGGQAVQQWQAKVNTFWKPVLLFGEAGDDWIGDVAKSNVNDNDKRFHNWGQSESGMADLIERLSKPGQLVCDPFLGGGTTAVCCLALGRKFVGGDIKSDCVEKAIRRCETQFIA